MNIKAVMLRQTMQITQLYAWSHKVSDETTSGALQLENALVWHPVVSSA